MGCGAQGGTADLLSQTALKNHSTPTQNPQNPQKSLRPSSSGGFGGFVRGDLLDFVSPVGPMFTGSGVSVCPVSFLRRLLVWRPSASAPWPYPSCPSSRPWGNSFLGLFATFRSECHFRSSVLFQRFSSSGQTLWLKRIKLSAVTLKDGFTLMAAEVPVN